MYQLNTDNILHSSVHNEEVVYHKEANIYVTLNETMKIVFDGIRNELPESEILDQLTSHYDVDKDKCEASLRRAINKLIEHDIIKNVEEA